MSKIYCFRILDNCKYSVCNRILQKSPNNESYMTFKLRHILAKIFKYSSQKPRNYAPSYAVL